RIPQMKAAPPPHEPTLLVTGRVTDFSARETRATEDFTDSKKAKHVRHRRKLALRYAVAVNLVDVDRGEVYLTREFPCSQDQEPSADDGPPPEIPTAPIFQKCKDDIAEAFSRAIAPYSENRTVYFKKGGDLPETESGINFATQGAWASSID